MVCVNVILIQEEQRKEDFKFVEEQQHIVYYLGN